MTPRTRGGIGLGGSEPETEVSVVVEDTYHGAIDTITHRCLAVGDATEIGFQRGDPTMIRGPRLDVSSFPTGRIRPDPAVLGGGLSSAVACASRRVVLILIVIAIPLGHLAGQTPVWTLTGTNVGDMFGFSLAGLGDLNGDGRADFVVGSVFADANGPSSGAATIFSGATGSALYNFVGESAGDDFGRWVAGAGDVNGDGTPDVIIGAILDDNSGIDSGSARVFSGATGAVLHTFNGDGMLDYLGWCVASAGDVNADGFADVIVGAPAQELNSAPGFARVISGVDGSILFTFMGSSPGDNMGYGVSGAGDINGDGHSDLIAAAPGPFGNSTFPGHVRVYSGANGALLYDVVGPAPGSEFGHAVSGARDVSGDGVPDIVIGARGTSFNGAYSGSVWVYSGADGALLHVTHGDAAGDQLGWSVATTVDLDGDGISDILVGATGAGNGTGAVKVISGQTGVVVFTVVGASEDDWLGHSVSSIGDVNADGCQEFGVGAPGPLFNNSLPGYVRVVSSLPSCQLLTLTSVFPNRSSLFGGVPVTIEGAGFGVAGVTARIGGAVIAGQIVVDPQHITGFTPPLGIPQAADVSVTTLGGSVMLSAVMTYDHAVLLASPQPTQLGSSLSLRIASYPSPAGTPVVFAVDTEPGPVSLGQYGMAGLGLSQNLDAILDFFGAITGTPDPSAVLDVTGQWSVSGVVPNWPVLLGQVWYGQAFVFTYSPLPPNQLFWISNQVTVTFAP